MNNRMPPLGRNPIQAALDDYNQIADENTLLKSERDELITHNRSLISEVNMLREAYEAADADRIRLTQVSSTLHGELKGIQAIINSAVATAVKEGVQAAERHQAKIEATVEEQHLQHAGDEAQEILQRVEPIAPVEEYVAPAEDHTARVDEVERELEQLAGKRTTTLPANQL